MNEVKQAAIDTMTTLHSNIPYDAYCTVMDGLQEIESLQERDEDLEELWRELWMVPVDKVSGRIEKPFMGWKPGTHREEIDQWFDARHSMGLVYLRYGDEFSRTPEDIRLLGLRDLCFECGSAACHYNHQGECRFPLVHERAPRINDQDGCVDFDYHEGND